MAAATKFVDWYGIFDLSSDATAKEIRKAYKKCALKYHPDKNPNKNAADKFLLLKEALEILTDPASKAKHDGEIKARLAAHKRHNALSNDRKRHKENLEARERAAEEQKKEKKAEEERRAKLARMRLENEEELEKENARVQREYEVQLAAYEKEMSAYQQLKDEVSVHHQISVKWKVKKGDTLNGGYSKSTLERAFSKYSSSVIVVIAKKPGLAMLDLGSELDALTCKAIEGEVVVPSNPLRSVTWKSGGPTECSQQPAHTVSESELSYQDHCAQEGMSYEDYESSVLDRIRRMAKKRKAEEELEARTRLPCPSSKDELMEPSTSGTSIRECHGVTTGVTNDESEAVDSPEERRSWGAEIPSNGATASKEGLSATEGSYGIDASEKSVSSGACLPTAGCEASYGEGRPSVSSVLDYESISERTARQAEERRKIIEELEAQE